MFNRYQITPLEAWIESLLNHIGIRSRYQLNIIEVASRLNIWFHYMDMPSKAVERNGLLSMCINRQLPPREQWEDFLHELCHLLRHAGRQNTMPELFVEWQEVEADNFQMFAALPFYLLKEMHLPQLESELIEFLADEFQVTFELAQRRVEQIQRRINQLAIDEETRCYIKKQQKTYDPSKWSPATRAIMDKLHRQLQSKGEMIRG